MRHALCLPVQRWAESRLRAEVAGEVTAQCRGGRGAAGRCMARANEHQDVHVSSGGVQAYTDYVDSDCKSKCPLCLPPFEC
ncbi:unnamed protein product [Miscanthus lutarioriparius]|uniref:Uncharacterized protein n=1 Tax=Miscanthus lutarioriparius TaxID=422564 RepID=A0A811PCI3_9POAL|nr:unnamed protein product [Miscanthus lutarioriparius]